MISSALLLSGLAYISICVPAVYSVLQNETFESKAVSLGELPYQIILQNTNTAIYFCGGSLITTQYVLTAAQCVDGRRAEGITVHAGTVSLDNVTDHRICLVSEIIIHNPLIWWRHDIALLKLQSHLLLTTYVGPIRFFEFNRTSRHPKIVTVSGYGITPESQEPPSRQLLKRNIHISPLNNCKHIYKITLNVEIIDTHICAYDPHTFNQNRTSDVGGPLVVNGTLLGFASGLWSLKRLSSNPLHHLPLVFINVSSYQNWIEHIINRTI